MEKDAQDKGRVEKGAIEKGAQEAPEIGALAKPPIGAEEQRAPVGDASAKIGLSQKEIAERGLLWAGPEPERTSSPNGRGLWPSPDPQDLAAVQAASLEILATIGFRILEPEAVELFKAAGAEAKGQIVYLPSDMVCALLDLAPESFSLRARNPEKSLTIGDGTLRLAAGYGCAAVSEPGKPRRPSTIADYARLAKLIQAEPLMDLCGGILAQPTEIKSEMASPAMAYAAILASDKPLMLMPAEPRSYGDLLSLAAIPYGGLRELAEAPSTIALISVSSPLTLDRPSCRTLVSAAVNGQAMVISPGPMAGSTGPATLAGNLAQANAECLAAICLAQLVRPGSPVIYGVTATSCDLRTGSVSIGGPEYALQALFAKELAKLNGLPCRCGGAVTDADSLSAQSGWESAFQLMASMASGVDLIIHSAGIVGSFGAVSFEKLICDFELISITKRFLEGVKVTEETLAMDVIKSVGPGGLYLNHRHTLQNARKEPWYPKVGQRGRVPEDQNFDEIIIESARDQERRLLSSYSPPPVKEAEKLDQRMLELGAAPELLAEIKGYLGL
ncbi:MAG: trimethylamine methyltransferase family protein [Deltaproteobacteria bacterium]|jgi:trimethylamine--corrinoid protein Co-methyltransferase|nr:trimethylamine methyltransferase family protein [Deltaproteobacteria bacterium]